MFRSPSFQRYQHEGLLFSFCFVVFSLLFSKPIGEEFAQVIQQPDYSSPALAWLLTILLCLHFWALPKKLNIVKRVFIEKSKDVVLISLLGFLASTFIKMIFIFIVLKLFGFDMSKPEAYSSYVAGFLTLGLFVLVIWGIITILFNFSDNDLHRYKRPYRGELFIDLILFFYIACFHSVFWGSVRPKIQYDSIVSYLLYLGVGFLFYLFLYIPVRIPYFLEEWAELDSAAGQRRFWFGLFLLFISYYFSF